MSESFSLGEFYYWCSEVFGEKSIEIEERY